MTKLLISSAAAMFIASSAFAAIPVIDNANLNQAIQITENTQSIMDSDKKIMEHTQKILEAVTGDRTSEAGEFAKMALGGFKMGDAPDLGSVISGGALSFLGMGDGAQDVVKKMMDAMQLVKSISGLLGDDAKSFDKAYESSVNAAATIVGLVDSTQDAVKKRSEDYQSGAQQIGKAKDLKGSIDQNSQIQAQNGLTLNELGGVMNNAVTAVNQQNLDYLNRMSMAAKAIQVEPMSFD